MIPFAESTPRDTLELLKRMYGLLKEEFEALFEKLMQVPGMLWNRALDTPWSTWEHTAGVLFLVVVGGVVLYASNEKYRRHLEERKHSAPAQEKGDDDDVP